jgi:hypothetical protein
MSKGALLFLRSAQEGQERNSNPERNYPRPVEAGRFADCCIDQVAGNQTFQELSSFWEIASDGWPSIGGGLTQTPLSAYNLLAQEFPGFPQRASGCFAG